MASEVSICNRGLQKLGAARITSLTDLTSKNAKACNANYAEIRDTELRKHAWGFSIKLVQLAADTDGPVFGKTNYFTIPSDCLRILPPIDYAVDWELHGRKIATNYSAPLDLRYVKQITDPNTMDAAFREMLSSKLAEELCEELTQSNKKKAVAKQDYADALAEARRMNAYERISQDLPESDWVAVRTSGINRLRASNSYV